MPWPLRESDVEIEVFNLLKILTVYFSLLPLLFISHCDV